jgi:hypothetical protein
MNNINLEFEEPDARPVFILEDVKGADFFNVNAEVNDGSSLFWLKDVTDFSIERVNNLEKQSHDKIDNLKLQN